MRARSIQLIVIVLVIAIFMIASCVSTRSTAVIQRIDEEDVEIRGAVPHDSFSTEPSQNAVREASIDEAIRACSRYDREPELLSYSVDLVEAGFYVVEWEYFVLYACIDSES